MHRKPEVPKGSEWEGDQRGQREDSVVVVVEGMCCNRDLAGMKSV